MSELKIDREVFGDVVVLAPHGRVDTATAKAFEAALLEAVGGGARRLVLDFGALDYISSAGLRVVLLGGKRLKEANGSLALCGLKPTIRDVFEISGFLALFRVADDRPAAIAALAA